MDPNTVVLEISSDEEVDWDDHVGKGIIDGSDDHNWIAELLDEVNKEDYGENDRGEDSDEVVLVSEVLPSRKSRKKVKFQSSSLIDLDDDCMILDHDPDKPVDIRKDNQMNGDEADDSDELLVVSEKGQVACRDYPHPRHLCIKFPFSSSPNQSHCEQCYCYVCDSLAPCMYWGNGSSSIHHCHATDKDEFWRLERKNSKTDIKGVGNSPKFPEKYVSNTTQMNLPPPLPVLVRPISTAHNHGSRPAHIRPCSISTNFGTPNIINQNRNPIIYSRNKYQQNLLAQHLIRTNTRRHNSNNLGTSFHRPVFKRPGSERFPYGSYRENYQNAPAPSGRYDGSLQSNMVNTSRPFSPQTYAPSTVSSLPEASLPFQPEFSHQLRSNSPFDFSHNFQPRVNSDPFLESPDLFQPRVASSQPSYSVPSKLRVDSPLVPASDYTQNQAQSSTIDPHILINSSDYSQNVSQQGNQDPNFQDYDINWSPRESNQQIVTESSEHENVAPTNEPLLATVSGGLVDYRYDNWIFDHQPVEPGSADIPVLFGLNEFSPDHGLIDPGNIFHF